MTRRKWIAWVGMGVVVGMLVVCGGWWPGRCGVPEGRLFVDGSDLGWLRPGGWKRGVLASGRGYTEQFGRAWHDRRRNVLVVPVEGPGWKIELREYDLKGHLLARREVPWLDMEIITVSPDGEWFVGRGYDPQAKSHLLRVARLDDPAGGYRLVNRNVRPGSVVWCGEYIYYSTCNSKNRCWTWRVSWRGGRPEELPWRGEILGEPGHDPERILLYRARKDWIGDLLVADPRRPEEAPRLLTRRLYVRGGTVEVSDGVFLVGAEKPWPGVLNPLFWLRGFVETVLLYCVDVERGTIRSLGPDGNYNYGFEWIAESWFEKPSPLGAGGRSGEGAERGGAGAGEGPGGR